jgi:hypothetical protein
LANKSLPIHPGRKNNGGHTLLHSFLDLEEGEGTTRRRFIDKTQEEEEEVVSLWGTVTGHVENAPCASSARRAQRRPLGARKSLSGRASNMGDSQEERGFICDRKHTSRRYNFDHNLLALTPDSHPEVGACRLGRWCNRERERSERKREIIVLLLVIVGALERERRERKRESSLILFFFVL